MSGLSKLSAWDFEHHSRTMSESSLKYSRSFDKIHTRNGLGSGGLSMRSLKSKLSVQSVHSLSEDSLVSRIEKNSTESRSGSLRNVQLDGSVEFGTENTEIRTIMNLRNLKKLDKSSLDKTVDDDCINVIHITPRIMNPFSNKEKSLEFIPNRGARVYNTIWAKKSII